MTSLYDIDANITWYKLNAHPFDSTLLYMKNVFLKAQKAVTFNYSIVDINIIIDKSPILQYGNFSCSVPGKEAYFDSWLTCQIFQLPFFLEKIQFSYICYAVILPILLISLFGGIKESYRWFLLNQAIWDTLICYDFICEKPTLISWSVNGISFNQPQSTCFYHNKTDNWLTLALGFSIRNSIRFLPFTGTLLLTFSRFCCIYFPLFYKKHAKPYKVIAFIIIFDILFLLLLNIGEFAKPILDNIEQGYRDKCDAECKATPPCNIVSAKYFNCMNKIYMWYTTATDIALNIIYYISPGIFLLSNIFAFFLFFKIGWQLKYQLQNHQSSAATSLRIALVIAFQCFTMTIEFILMSIQTYSYLFVHFNFLDFTILKSMPPLLFLLQHYSTTTCFNVIRVFLDSLMVLLVLSGYRDKLFGAFKLLIYCIIKPKTFWIKFKAKFVERRSGVVFLSSSGKAY